MTNNVKTLIEMLKDNGFTVSIYADDMVIVEDALDKLKDLFPVYGKSQLGTATIGISGTVDYLVDGILFTYLPF